MIFLSFFFRNAWHGLGWKVYRVIVVNYFSFDCSSINIVRLSVLGSISERSCAEKHYLGPRTARAVTVG